MTYRDQIDVYFKRFKKSDRSLELYAFILKDMGEKYRRLIEQGYTKLETEEKLVNETKNLQVAYPVINSLPRTSAGDTEATVTMMYVVVVLYLLVSLGLYWFVPILAFIPQFIMGVFVLKWFQSYPSRLLHIARKKMTLSLFGLLVIQMIAMNIRYFPTLGSFAFLSIIYGFIYALFWFGYLMFRKHKEEMPKKSLILVIADGPTIIKNVNTNIYMLFLACSTLLYAGHFVFILIDELFRTS